MDERDQKTSWSGANVPVGLRDIDNDDDDLRNWVEKLKSDSILAREVDVLVTNNNNNNNNNNNKITIYKAQ